MNMFDISQIRVGVLRAALPFPLSIHYPAKAEEERVCKEHYTGMTALTSGVFRSS